MTTANVRFCTLVFFLSALPAAFTSQNAAGRSPQQQAQDTLAAAGEALGFVEREAARPVLAAELRQLEKQFVQSKADSKSNWPVLGEQAKRLQRRIILSHPLLDFENLLFIERDILATAPGYQPTTEQGPFYDGVQSMDQCFGHNARKGGGLYLLKKWRSESPERVDLVAGLRVPSGTNRGMLLSEGAFMSPALSYDGKTVLFAWVSGGHEKWKPENRFNLFRVNVDGSGLARLTDGDFDDFNPCWLPGGQIAFISTRRGGFGRCHPRPVPTYTLFEMNGDGSDIRCLSYHETNEWQPSVDHNGKLLYTRWDYIDRDAVIAIHPWTCFPDGRDPRAIHGNYPLPLTTMIGSDWPNGRFFRPMCEHDVRAIPNSRKYIAVATPHHNQSYGSLVMIDPSIKDDGRMSQLKRLTPEVKFPENEGGELAYGTPWPLREDLYLCNYRDTLCVLYFPGGKGVLVPFYQGSRLRPTSPIPLRSTVPPPILPAQVAGKSDPAVPATIYVENVLASDDLGRLPEGTKVTAMRIIQVYPKTTPLEDQPRISHFSESLVRASLGTVPVEADGSVYCVAPVGKEVYFQLLDERGVAVRLDAIGHLCSPRRETPVCQLSRGTRTDAATRDFEVGPHTTALNAQARVAGHDRSGTSRNCQLLSPGQAGSRCAVRRLPSGKPQGTGYELRQPGKFPLRLRGTLGHAQPAPRRWFANAGRALRCLGRAIVYRWLSDGTVHALSRQSEIERGRTPPRYSLARLEFQ